MLKGTGTEAWIASPLTTFMHLFWKEPPWNKPKVVATLFPDGGWAWRGINTAFIKKHKDIHVLPLPWPFWGGISTVEGIFQLYDISILFLELPMVFHVVLDQLSQRGKLLSPVEVIVVTCVLDLDVGDSSSSSKIWKRGQKKPSPSQLINQSIDQSVLHLVMVEKSILAIPAWSYCRRAELLCFSFSAHQPGRTGQFCAGGSTNPAIPHWSPTRNTSEPHRIPHTSTRVEDERSWTFWRDSAEMVCSFLQNPHQLPRSLPQETFAFACCHSL